jgi:O-antigen ligase
VQLSLDSPSYANYTRRSGSSLITLIAIVNVLPAAESLRFGSVSLSSVTTVFVAFFLFLEWGRRGFIVEKVAGGVVVAILLMILLILAAGEGKIGGQGGAQQITVWLGFSFALLSGSHPAVHRDINVVAVMDVAMKIAILVMTTAVMLSRFSLATTGSRSAALAALVPLSWFLARVRCGEKDYLRWALICSFIPLFTLSRAATAISALLLVVAVPRSIGRTRLRRLLLIVGLGISAFLLFNYYAPIRQRNRKGDLSLSFGPYRVNAAGRTKVWSDLWNEVQGNWVFGHGMATSRVTSGHFDHPHQDYLRLLYEGGAFALMLWLFALTFLFVQLRRRLYLSSTGANPFAFCGMFLLITVSLAALTDNVLVYSWVMIPTGIMAGLALSSHQGIVRRRSAMKVRAAVLSGSGAHQSDRFSR